MSVQHTRSSEPLVPGEVRVRGIAWWGMLIGILILGTFLGSLIASYLYLRSGAPSWPPAGVEPPPVLRPLLVTLLVALSAVGVNIGYGGIGRDRGQVLLGALLISTTLATGAVMLHSYELLGLPLRFDEHAYASLIWLLRGFELTLLVAGIVMNVTMIAQYAQGLVDDHRHQHVAVTSLFWWFVAVTSALVFATLNLVPHLS